jgi:glycosidase
MKKPVLALLALCGVAAAQPAEGTVFYEIFLRSFQDSNGDGVGDLRGATERLDYLQDLGVGGVWLMPLHPSPSYHGYDVTNYKSVNPDYGTLADFKVFLDAAHARDIDVILDLVVNHTSSQHPWFVAAKRGEARSREFYSFRNEDPGWQGLGGRAWHPSDDDFYLGLFWSEMPDLNLRNPAVLHEMQGVARYWLDMGVDGFRVDAIQHILESDTGVIANTPENIAWVGNFERFIKSVKPDAYLVGETWTDTGTIVRYHERAQLDLSFNYPLFTALTASVQDRDPSGLAYVLEEDARLYPADALSATFISNHDQIRPGTALGFLRRDEARLKLASGLLLTLPGTPFIYYGEELGLPNGPGDADEEKRTPMPWDYTANGFTTGTPWYAPSSDEPELTVAAQEADPDSVLNWYKTLISLRKARPALARGTLTLEPQENPALLAFVREAGGERLLVLANFDDETQVDTSAYVGATELLTGKAVGETLAMGEMGLAVLEFP